MRVAVDGTQVYAYTGGRALDVARPTIVFVHGAAHDHSVFALQSRYFAHHGYAALAVDLPAHGRSDGAPLASVEAIADWIGALLDALDVSEASLVGHSMGALAALEAAARIPRRVAARRAARSRRADGGERRASRSGRPRRSPRVRAHQRLVAQRRQAARRQHGAGPVDDRSEHAADGAIATTRARHRSDGLRAVRERSRSRGARCAVRRSWSSARAT